MNCLRLIICPLFVLLGASPCLNAAASHQDQANAEPIYANVPGNIVLDNDRVVVQRFVIQPGQSTGRHAHTAHQLLVFVRGGILRSMTGRSSFWPDGRVVWQEDAGHDDGATNTGRTPIEVVWVRLKPARFASHPIVSRQSPTAGYLNYPNIPGEDVLENDQMIVQRFKMNPGEWEGIHAHNPNTFYIFIKGGEWVSKSKMHPDGVPGSAADGLVAWMDTIGLTEEHQSGNTGTTSTEVVWVALKD
jgi:predicted metal-dependent enzyme (double-stranded beta helix superfamily)